MGEVLKQETKRFRLQQRQFLADLGLSEYFSRKVEPFEAAAAQPGLRIFSPVMRWGAEAHRATDHAISRIRRADGITDLRAAVIRAIDYTIQDYLTGSNSLSNHKNCDFSSHVTPSLSPKLPE